MKKESFSVGIPLPNIVIRFPATHRSEASATHADLLERLNTAIVEAVDSQIRFNRAIFPNRNEVDIVIDPQ